MNLFSLKGKTAVVIGAASGIGEAIAAGFAAQGARVVALDLKPDPARRDRRGGHLRLAARWTASFDEVDREQGVDIAVCMPAVNVRKPILKYTDEELAFVLNVNIQGNFSVLRAAGRVMTARKKGSIILFSSIRSQVVEPGQSAYAATKAGIVQLARTAAAEFGPHGVRVNAIAPGRDRDAAHRADQGQQGVVRRLRRQERLQSLGPARGDRRRRRVPGLGRGQLCDRIGSLRRRRLDGRRRPVHAAGHVGAPSGGRRKRRNWRE